MRVAALLVFLALFSSDVTATTSRRRAFLESLPTPEALMPPLVVAEIEAAKS